jgi:predicted Rossmann-fold nucleotide-binding protein
MPGGIGTLEELVEQMTWLQLGQHKKPLLLLNLKNFWAPLLALIEHQKEMGFIPRDSIKFLVAERPEQIVPMLRDAARDISEEELHGRGAKLVAEEM